MSARSADRVAVVTGGGGALATAVVETLTGRGAHVVAVDRSIEAMQQLPSRVQRGVADLTDPAAVDGLFARVVEEHGRVDAAVHTVGTFRGGSVVDSSVEDYRMLLEVNLGTAWWVSRAAATVMTRGGGGSIVHIGARNGVEPSGGAAAYGVTKAAVVHLTRTLEVELRSSGVRVNVVLPGLIDTAANRASFSAGTMAAAVTPEAIAGVVAFLVSPEAAAVSGAVIPVYGTAAPVVG